MKHIETINKRKIKKIFNNYFLPFSLNEYFLLFNFLILQIFPIISIARKGFIFINLLFIIPLFFLVLIVYNRFFKVVKTNLDYDENIRIIKDIAQRQKHFFKSPIVNGLYMFEIQNKINKEYIVFICENNKIFINNFHERRLYNIFGRTIKNLKNLILIKVIDFSKKRINNYS